MRQFSPDNQHLSAEAFAHFLARLSPDPDQASEEYEELRRMLVKFFECRGSHFADETINRAIRRLKAGEAVQHLAAYCFSIARFLWLEQARSPERKRVDLESLLPLAAPIPEESNEESNDDTRLACLRECLGKLSDEQRALFLEYYQDERRARIDHRQAMAERLSLRRNALTKRMVRLREKLEACINRCVRKTT